MPTTVLFRGEFASFVRRLFMDNTNKTGNGKSEFIDALKFFLLLVGVTGAGVGAFFLINWLAF